MLRQSLETSYAVLRSVSFVGLMAGSSLEFPLRRGECSGRQIYQLCCLPVLAIAVYLPA